MKTNVLVATFILITTTHFSQTNYSKETLGKIAAFESSLAGRVKVASESNYSIYDRMRYYNIKGMSVAVVHNYKIEWAKGYGWADELEKRPVDTETLFEPGSISKSLNAVGILKLVQDKKVDLYEDINTYLVSWKFPYDSVSKNKKITLAQLLSHSAGLTVHGFRGYDLEEALPTVPQILDGEKPANSPAVRSEFEPGLKFKYSGGGTTISQLLLTDVTQEKYESYMYQNVLKPMGMENSFYSQPAPKAKRKLCATGYYSDGNPVPNKFHVYPEQAAAGLWMTPTDLCHYIIETQLAFEGKSSKVLNQELTKLRLSPYNNYSAALGVFIENRNNAYYFQHGAGNEGFCGQYYGSLKGGNGMVVFLNSSNNGIITEILNSVAQVYEWENFYTPIYKTNVFVEDSILQSYVGVYFFEDKWASIYKKDKDYFYLTDGIESKMYFTSNTEFFNKEFMTEKLFLKNTDGKVYGFKRKLNDREFSDAIKITNADTLNRSNEDLNNLGWHLIENSKFAEAKMYLTRAVELYPGDLILLGNLAHSYLFNGEYSTALEIYRAHLKESIEGSFTWEKMIQDDFTFFKNKGFDTSRMANIFKDLNLNPPKGF